MGKFLVNLHFLKAIPNELRDKLTTIVVSDGDVLNMVFLDDSI
jgi:hypothetical protein